MTAPFNPVSVNEAATGVRWWGFSCYGCGGDFDIPMAELPEGLTDRHEAGAYLAGLAGWGMGHWDGQAHYVCAECTHAVWDFRRFELPPSCVISPDLRRWLFSRGVVFTESWTGRSPYAWTPARQLARRAHAIFYRLRAAIVPWTVAEAGSPPTQSLLRARFADGSEHVVFWTDGSLRRDLADGWYSTNDAAPIGDEYPLVCWKYA